MYIIEIQLENGNIWLSPPLKPADATWWFLRIRELGGQPVMRSVSA